VPVPVPVPVPGLRLAGRGGFDRPRPTGSVHGPR
jgi:hypothetical protein